MVLLEEASKGKGGDPAGFEALVVARTTAERRCFDLAMSLPVGSGKMRVVQMKTRGGEEGYVEHIAGMGRALQQEVSQLSAALAVSKSTLSDEEVATLEAAFEGDAFVPVGERGGERALVTPATARLPNLMERPSALTKRLSGRRSLTRMFCA